MKQFLAAVIANRQIAADFYEMEMSWDPHQGIPQPGQFLTIRVSPQTSPLLRRPFAFSGFDLRRQSASIIYQKRGSATEILAGKTPGQRIDCIGPLGKGFEPNPVPRHSLCVAGGMGVGPIVYWAHSLLLQHESVKLVLGAAAAARLPRFTRWEELKPIVCTDDGSEGFHGTVVDYLKSLEGARLSGHTLYCCGPGAMLKACHAFAVVRGLECFVSVEQIMACGVGACMGCVIEITGEKKYARVCTEGPVFNSNEIVWK
jgi:dihydroorotate dehydrogenase electron transfer subunit